MAVKKKTKAPLIPKTITIVGDEYPIEALTRENLQAYEITDAPDNALGLCNQLKGVILIRPMMGLSRTRSTLLHEVLHVIVGQSYLDLPPEKEEQIVTLLSQLLWETFSTNKAFVKFMFEGKED